MRGSPSATASGQNDGDGRCTPVASPVWAASSTVATRTTVPSSFSAYLACHHSSRPRTWGTVSKLCVGTGDGIDHSRLRASHGSGPGGGRCGASRLDLTTFHMNTTTLTAISSDPTVAAMFQNSNP